MHVCMCIYTYTYSYAYAYTHSSTHTYTYTNTHAHTHTKRTAPQAVRRRSRWGEKCGFKIASCPSGVGSAFGLRPGLFFFRGPVSLFFLKKKATFHFFFHKWLSS